MSNARGTKETSGDGAVIDTASRGERRRSAWMAAAQDGDGAAYDALLRDCLPIVRAAARGHGVSPNSVDDVVQDVLLTIHQVRRNYDPSRSFDAWLRGIVRHRAFDTLRRQGRLQARELYEPEIVETHPDPTEPTLGVMERDDRANSLRKAVAGLPTAQREAVEQVLRDATSTEAAVATGKTRGALKVNLHRALKALRRTLVNED